MHMPQLWCMFLTALALQLGSKVEFFRFGNSDFAAQSWFTSRCELR